MRHGGYCEKSEAHEGYCWAAGCAQCCMLARCPGSDYNPNDTGDEAGPETSQEVT